MVWSSVVKLLMPYVSFVSIMVPRLLKTYSQLRKIHILKFRFCVVLKGYVNEENYLTRPKENKTTCQSFTWLILNDEL